MGPDTFMLNARQRREAAEGQGQGQPDRTAKDICDSVLENIQSSKILMEKFTSRFKSEDPKPASMVFLQFIGCLVLLAYMCAVTAITKAITKAITATKVVAFTPLHLNP